MGQDARVGRPAERLGDAEIDDLDREIGFVATLDHHQVGGFDIAMHQSACFGGRSALAICRAI